MTNKTFREELLLKMYDQMFNDINRHIIVVWQSIGVLVAAFAFLALTEKQIISIDYSISLILIVAGWLLAHCEDASYWYNRNLIIIANIERQFLIKEDLKNIHYYFGEHRPENKMIDHLHIQTVLAWCIVGLLLFYHFSSRIYPVISECKGISNLELFLPYLTLVSILAYVDKMQKKTLKKYNEFLLNSPGVDIDTEGIQYGAGHGFGDNVISDDERPK